LGVLTFFLMPFLANLALAVLAAIVVFVMAEVSDPRYFLRLWQVRRLEFVVAVATFLGVLTLGVQSGLVIGVLLALVVLADHIHNPPTAVVGRTRSGVFADVEERDDVKEIPGMLIWRQYAPLVFLNARRLSNELRRLVGEREGLEVVVLDASATSVVDTTGTTEFAVARDNLAAAGVELWVVNPRPAMWTRVVAALDAVGAPVPPRFDSLAEAVTTFERRRENERPE
jgi:MFS superfamily sulfate permease-like transporter